MGNEGNRRNLIIAAGAIAVAAVALVLVIVLSGDDGGDKGSTVSTQPPAAGATGTTGTTGTVKKHGKRKGGQGSSNQNPAAGGTKKQRERKQRGSIRQRVAGTGVETIRVRNGVPVDGLARLIYSRGDRVRLKIVTNGDERFAIPILDLSEQSSSGSAEFDFTATRSGLYGVELRSGKARTRVAVLAIH
jgi:hypothetical protein